MATYAEIQKYTRSQHGFMPQTCWIAHVKEMSGLEVRVSHRRYDSQIRQVPCPPEKVQPIIESLRHFNML